MKHSILAVVMALFLSACGMPTETYQAPQTGKAFATLKASNAFAINSIDNRTVHINPSQNDALKITPGIHAIEIETQSVGSKTIVIIATIAAGHHYNIAGTNTNGHIQVWLSENGKRVSQVYSG